jgi:hypothetical protein
MHAAAEEAHRTDTPKLPYTASSRAWKDLLTARVQASVQNEGMRLRKRKPALEHMRRRLQSRIHA